MIRTVVFSLLAINAALCIAMLRRRAEYPITTAAMLAVAAGYGYLSWVRFSQGAWPYYHAVESSRWIYMLASATVVLESVRLMARRLQAPNFALATSILFAGLSGCAAWGAGHGLRTSSAGFTREQEWAIACVLFLVANHWLHRRAGELPPLAARHAMGAMVMLTGNATAFLLLGECRGVYWAEVAGLLVQRLGPMAGLIIWMRPAAAEYPPA